MTASDAYVQEYAGRTVMANLAREDARRKLKWLIENPRGTHCGRTTPDSISYVTEMQHILDAARR